MTDTTNWKIPKWPFLLGNAALLVAAYFFVLHEPKPSAHWEIPAACIALGAILGCLPFILDYRAVVKAIEASALGSITEKIQNLEKLATQISSATNEWTNAQSQAEKTSASAKEISDKMAAEVQQFTAFMQKMNDSEKSALRLEVEKMKRGETEWLQVLVRILDHVFLLHAAAARSGQPKVADQIANFQNACRDAARRIGLTPFIAAPDEKFDPARHQTVDDSKPPANAVVTETVGAGFTFQGKLLRPALVKLREENPVAEKQESPEQTKKKSEDELLLQPPD
jgi:molecular chaperone GrpE (heat shock protein)